MPFTNAASIVDADEDDLVAQLKRIPLDLVEARKNVKKSRGLYVKKKKSAQQATSQRMADDDDDDVGDGDSDDQAATAAGRRSSIGSTAAKQTPIPAEQELYLYYAVIKLFVRDCYTFLNVCAGNVTSDMVLIPSVYSSRPHGKEALEAMYNAAERVLRDRSYNKELLKLLPEDGLAMLGDDVLPEHTRNDVDRCTTADSIKTMVNESSAFKDKQQFKCRLTVITNIFSRGAGATAAAASQGK